MFLSAIIRSVPIVALSAWLLQPTAAAGATRTYEVALEPRAGCPVEIVEAVVLVQAEQANYDLMVRNVSRKKIVHVRLRWTALTETGRPVQDRVVSFLPDKNFKPKRTWHGAVPAPVPAVDVERFSVAVVRVRFADRTVWPAVERIASIREAAEAGNPAAQYELGRMYREGRDAALDPLTAYVWFHLAALGGHGPAGEARDELAETLTPEQIEEARHLVKKWGFIQFMGLFE